MRSKVSYEWCAELTDTESGDALDLHFADTLADARRLADTMDCAEGEHVEICLVRNEGNEIDGITDRQFAYLKNDKLPDFFCQTGSGEFQTDTHVPQRFHKEVAC